MGLWSEVKKGKYPKDAAPGYCGPTKHGFFCLLDEGHLTRYGRIEEDIASNHVRAEKKNADRQIRRKMDINQMIYARWWLYEQYHNPFSLSENSDLHSAYAIGHNDAVERLGDLFWQETHGKKYVRDFSYFDKRSGPLRREEDPNYKIEQMNLW